MLGKCQLLSEGQRKLFNICILQRLVPPEIHLRRDILTLNIRHLSDVHCSSCLPALPNAQIPPIMSLSVLHVRSMTDWEGPTIDLDDGRGRYRKGWIYLQIPAKVSNL